MTARRPPARHADPIRARLLALAAATLLARRQRAAHDRRRVQPAVEDGAGLQPTIQYEEAVAHADDRIDFKPGERVSVGFKPRGSDGWTVDGGRAQALPAGRLSGHALRDQRKAAAATREAAFAGETPGPAGVAVGRADVAYVAPGNALEADLSSRAAAEVDHGVRLGDVGREFRAFDGRVQVGSAPCQSKYSWPSSPR